MTDYLEFEVDLDDPRLAAAVDELSFWSSRFGALLADNLALRRGITALDVGCGSGFPLIELAQAHGRSCRFVGVDLWGRALERAAARIDAYRVPNATLVRGDGARLPFADRRFDLIVSNLGVNNFADPEATLAECARVARPGARIAITTNTRGHMREFYAVYREVLTELGMVDRLDRLEEDEGHRATADTLSAMLAGAGFVVRRTIEDRFRLRYLDGGALLRHSLTRLGFLAAWRRVVEPAREREVFLAVEARLDDRARERGELVMTIPMLYVEGRRV